MDQADGDRRVRFYPQDPPPTHAAISGEAVPATMPDTTNTTPHTSKWMLPTAVSFSCSLIPLSAASRAVASSCSLLANSSDRRFTSFPRLPTSSKSLVWLSSKIATRCSNVACEPATARPRTLPLAVLMLVPAALMTVFCCQNRGRRSKMRFSVCCENCCCAA